MNELFEMIMKNSWLILFLFTLLFNKKYHIYVLLIAGYSILFGFKSLLIGITIFCILIQENASIKYTSPNKRKDPENVKRY